MNPDDEEPETPPDQRRVGPMAAIWLAALTGLGIIVAIWRALISSGNHTSPRR